MSFSNYFGNWFSNWFGDSEEDVPQVTQVDGGGGGGSGEGTGGMPAHPGVPRETIFIDRSIGIPVSVRIQVTPACRIDAQVSCQTRVKTQLQPSFAKSTGVRVFTKTGKFTLELEQNKRVLLDRECILTLIMAIDHERTAA